MNNILILFSHPATHSSRVGKAMADAVADMATVRDLYQLYPDFFIDVQTEQHLLLQHDAIVFQHPMYWYGCPALMKEWIDIVLEYGFAYGNSKQLANKKWIPVVTTGAVAQAYDSKGNTVDEFFLPFKRTAQLCNMEYMTPRVYHGINHLDDRQLRECTEDYKQFIQQVRNGN